jgi:hypothetical protein
MKQTTAAFLLLALLSCAPAARATPDDAGQQLLVLARELEAQQKAIAENQAKIDAKLATIAEAARIARIYSSRGGAK